MYTNNLFFGELLIYYSFFLCPDFPTFWETLFRRFERHFFAPQERNIGYFESATGAPETDFWAPQASSSQNETDFGAAGAPEMKETILRPSKDLGDRRYATKKRQNV